MQVELSPDGEHRIQQHAHPLLGGDKVTDLFAGALEKLELRLLLRSHARILGGGRASPSCLEFHTGGAEPLAPVVRGPPASGMPAR